MGKTENETKRERERRESGREGGEGRQREVNKTNY